MRSRFSVCPFMGVVLLVGVVCHMGVLWAAPTQSSGSASHIRPATHKALQKPLVKTSTLGKDVPKTTKPAALPQRSAKMLSTTVKKVAVVKKPYDKTASTLLAFAASMPSLAPSAHLMTWHIPISLPSNLQASLPDKPTSASELYPVFNQPQLALRMEALRRAGQFLSTDEKAQLWAYLNQRRDQNVNDPNLYFDVGYADITLRLNKTGLFFLRKASERLRNPFASMAYAMAQADIDLYLEGGKPDTPSYRKLDVVYKLTDAIYMDVKKHTPGLWPTFVRIQQQLANYPAYTDFSQRDYSDTFIPYGERPKSYATASTFNCAVTPDKPASLTEQQSVVKPLYSQPVSLLRGGNGRQFQCLDFYPKPGQSSHYDIRIRHGERLVGNLESRVGSGIVEDLDGDGTYELVLRQYRIDPFHPIMVYRLTSTDSLQLDTTLQKQWFD
jgi:hypothetical protein